tara:strand:- start:28 stop:300 length:273 start_codon:yes stop_codon:yes gene_type:complete
MKVKELIKVLTTENPEQEIRVRTYNYNDEGDSNFDKIDNVGEITLGIYEARGGFQYEMEEFKMDEAHYTKYGTVKIGTFKATLITLLGHP